MACLRVIHRDLKPENILLNSSKAKEYDIRIADFGFALTLNKPVKENGEHEVINKVEMGVCGTPGFMPPEALRREGYSLKSDLFSVGSILFSLLT